MRLEHSHLDRRLARIDMALSRWFKTDSLWKSNTLASTWVGAGVP